MYSSGRTGTANQRQKEPANAAGHVSMSGAQSKSLPISAIVTRAWTHDLSALEHIARLWGQAIHKLLSPDHREVEQAFA